MNKKVLLLLVFLYFFSILSYDIDGARVSSKEYVPSSGGDEVITSKMTMTSDGKQIFNPSGGGALTKGDLDKILYQSGVENYFEYSLDDIFNTHKLLELVTENLGAIPIVLGKEEALITYDQVISKYDGTKYTKENILEILEKKGIGVFASDNNIIDFIRNKEIRNMLEKEINVKKLINVLEEESKGNVDYVCRRDAVWSAIVLDDDIIKFIKPEKECKYGCDGGKCIEKKVIKEKVKKVLKIEEIKSKSEQKIVGEEVPKNNKEKTIIFVEPQQFSVTKISGDLKPLIASEGCKPRCEHNCGEPNGCGGYCGNEHSNLQGKCGNPTIIEEPKNAAEAFENTASSVALVTQGFLSWLLVG